MIGYYPATKHLGSARGRCPTCRRDQEHAVIKQRSYLFVFVPVVPLGSASYFIQCQECGASEEIPQWRVEEAIAGATAKSE